MADIYENDEQLYSRFLAEHDESALKTLLERHRDGLTLFLFGYVCNMEDAEDLMMDTFARIITRSSWSMEGSSFKTWLFAIGRRLALMHLRKRKPETAVFTEEPADESAVPDLDLLREEQKRELYKAMEQLKPEYRQVLTLIYFEEMSHEEAARVMKKTKKQIYHLVDRGKERLKVLLQGSGYEHG